jgi:glycosyltransferase involved in cell wall biosynthesis
VLMTTDTLGGVFSYTLSLCSWLSRQDVRVTLASMGRPASSEQRRAAARAGAVLRESSYRLEWMDDPWDDVQRAGDWLLGLESEFTPDVIHLNGYAHAALGWNAPVCVVAHSCVLSWYRAVLGERAPQRFERYRAAVARGLLAATRVIAPTHAMLAMLRCEYGGLPVQAEVVHNGIHSGTRRPAAALSVKQNCVLSAGRLWDAAKNVVALQHVARSIPWPIHVAGDCTAPNANDAVSFPDLDLLGPLSRDALARRMDHAAIFAAPVTYEPFGLSILEAASSRCALVLGDIPSLRELWNECALFVEPRDSGALAAVLNRLIENTPLRERLAQLAHERAQGYGLERMASTYLRLYHTLRDPQVTARTTELSS